MPPRTTRSGHPSPEIPAFSRLEHGARAHDPDDETDNGYDHDQKYELEDGEGEGRARSGREESQERAPAIERKMLAGIPGALPSTEDATGSAFVARHAGLATEAAGMRPLVVRAVKSCLLVAKVCNLYLCVFVPAFSDRCGCACSQVLTLSSAYVKPHAQIHSAVAAAVLGAAVADSVVDDWRISVLLGLAHVAFIRWGDAWFV